MVFNNKLWLIGAGTSSDPKVLWSCTTADVCSRTYGITGWSGINPSGFTVVGNKAYFAGRDTSGV